MKSCLRVSGLTALVCCFILATVAPLYGTSSADELFKPVPDNKRAVGSVFAKRPEVIRHRSAEVDFSQLCHLEASVRLQGADSVPILHLNLFPDADHIVRIHQVEQSYSGGYLVYGLVDELPGAEFSAAINGENLFANISFPGHYYQIRPAGNGLFDIMEVDQSLFPPALPPVEVTLDHNPNQPSTSQSNPQVNSAADSGQYVDVLVVYTDDARAAVGGTTNMENLIDLAVGETNVGYANSGVTHRLRLVHSQEVPYNESNFNWSQTLSRLRSTNDGSMDNVHTLRDLYGADEVVLLVNNGGYCGLAYVMQSVSNSFASSAFAVVSWSCATGYYSFGHELGHNMGCAHNRANAGVNGAYNYSYGYQAPNEAFRTIMAYNCSGGCSRKNYWSNPDVMYGGQPMGIIYTDPLAADNRRTLNNTSYTTANFRQSIPTPEITVTAPNGGETLEVGQTYSITWTSSGTVGNVKIEYFNENQLSGVTIVSSTANDGSYSWTVPNDVSNQTVVKISEASDGSPYDYSDNVFTVQAPAASLTVTSPNGGEDLQLGSTHNITWNYSNLTGNVIINLYKNNVYVTTIKNTPVSSGTYSWSVSDALSAGNDYKIRIYQAGVVNDYSDADFTLSAPQTDPHSPDFNGDGIVDILWRYYGSGGYNAVWVRGPGGGPNGNTVNDPRKVAGTLSIMGAGNLNWRVRGTGDFNGDGKVDIVYRNDSDGRNWIWYMDGRNRIGDAFLPTTTNLDWKLVGCADFNGDNKPDLLWRNSVDGRNAVWYIVNAVRTGVGQLPVNADMNWDIKGTGDFNSDGNVDVVWRNSSNGQNQVWYMNNTSRLSTGSLPTVANLTWDITTSNDYNGDGKPDLLWHNYGNGNSFIWYMNNRTRLSEELLVRVSDTTWEPTK